MRYSVGNNYYRSNVTSPFDSPTSNYVIYQISSHLVHKQGHYGNISIFGTFGKKCGVGQLPLPGALKPPVRQLRNGFSNSAQNFDSETIFKPFGLDGWLKVSYLLDYTIYRLYEF